MYKFVARDPCRMIERIYSICPFNIYYNPGGQILVFHDSLFLLANPKVTGGHIDFRVAHGKTFSEA